MQQMWECWNTKPAGAVKHLFTVSCQWYSPNKSKQWEVVICEVYFRRMSSYRSQGSRAFKVGRIDSLHIRWNHTPHVRENRIIRFPFGSKSSGRLFRLAQAISLAQHFMWHGGESRNKRAQRDPIIVEHFRVRFKPIFIRHCTSRATSR